MSTTPAAANEAPAHTPECRPEKFIPNYLREGVGVCCDCGSFLPNPSVAIDDPDRDTPPHGRRGQ
jgi:hypothetical protein